MPEDYENNRDKYIKEYNITASSIGLSKARLDAAATWKTYGMISTRRKIDGVIYSQVYLVKPMAANANVKSSVVVQNEYILKETEDEIVIPIEYKTSVINMTGYADKKHIKEIKSSLCINGKKVDEVSGSKIISVGNKYLLVITREEYPSDKNHLLEIVIDGYMHTEFAVDGLMQNKITKTIKLYVEPKQIIPVKETSIKILEKSNNKLVVRPLAQNFATNDVSSGFTEGDKYLILKLDLNIKKEKIQDVNVYLDDNKLDFNNNYNSQNYILSFKIPDIIESTLYGEYSLRNKEGNFFNISKNLIGTRKQDPHKIIISFFVNGKKYVEKLYIDTLDRVLTNINNKILINTNYNKQDVILLEDWLNESS